MQAGEGLLFYESFVFRLDDVLKMKVLHVYFTESRYFIY